jgi:hypothetical protein
MNALHQREERLRREALTAGMAGPLEQIAKALRAYMATEMLDDALARDEAEQETEAPSLASDALTDTGHAGDTGSDDESADTLLTDLLRRRSRQRKNTTND